MSREAGNIIFLNFFFPASYTNKLEDEAARTAS